ncbi:MAG: hypothetical protein K0S76_965 [Herbinix sp.]|jgi:hypothetical protein|nr:hypothetical protein [Herbinix sp.]
MAFVCALDCAYAWSSFAGHTRTIKGVSNSSYPILFLLSVLLQSKLSLRILTILPMSCMLLRDKSLDMI